MDAPKKIDGSKRHVVADTLGLLVAVLVTAASVQDRARCPGCSPEPATATLGSAICWPTRAIRRLPCRP